MNVSFRTSQSKADKSALIDSGATDNFIDEETWKRLGIGKKELARPVTVHNIDGTENKQGKITHYCWLCIVKGEKHMLQRFYITALGKDCIILGYPFLYDFNPKINWKTGKVLGEPVQLQSSRYMHVAKRIFFMQREAVKQVGKPKEGEAIYVRRTNIAQEWAQKADQNKIHLTLDTIPKEYCKHQKVFSEEEARRFPPARSEDMTIKLNPDAPRELNCKVYPLSKDEHELLQKWILEEEELGRIYEGPSPYTAPVYFINKKDSSEKRIIMDYRQLNKHTVRDNNPLPNIQSALERLHGKLLFSKFDIRWGYNNIRIAEEDQHKAAFKTPQGTYVPQVMYFGLTNAPPFFQRTMHRDFRSLLQKYPENLGNYMDDWWVATANDEEGKRLHKQIVHEFLDKMEECSYFLKPKKCQFEKEEMEILGWLVGGGRVCIDPAKVQGISEWPRTLHLVEEVRKTLGVLGYQRPFIQGFASIAKPLHDLTKKGTQFNWTQKCTDALDELIKRVTTEPVLWHPDPAKPYELEVDASAFALGSILYQRDDNNKRRAVAYHSKALNQAERNYSIRDREFLAIIEGLKRMQHLVMGMPHKLTIYTDHDNLCYYRHPQKLNRRMARYIVFLADFNFELVHLPGKRNQADPLSRHPDHDNGSTDNEETTALPNELFARAIEITILECQVHQLQRENSKLCVKPAAGLRAHLTV